MDNIVISDITMSRAKETGKYQLTFREKLEISKLLDLLGVSVIELEEIDNPHVDSLCIKSVAGIVKNSIIAVPVSLFPLNIEEVWNVLSWAKKPRLQVSAPVSTVQMEYLYHKKPDDMLKRVEEAVSECKEHTDDVEFVANDATRSDFDFLCKMISSAIEKGASTVTVCDTAGNMLPEEFGEFIEQLYKNVPSLNSVTLGVSCSNELSMAGACVVSALKAGVREVKVTSLPLNSVSVADITNLVTKRQDAFNLSYTVKNTEVRKRLKQIAELCGSKGEKATPFENGVQEEVEAYLTSHDDKNDVLRVAEMLGYELSREDLENVWTAFCDIASHKEKISSKELDAIIASNAMQVPAAYKLQSYVITSSNTHGSTAHIIMECKGEKLEGLSKGDGPIDAAYLAIEQITGCHYELDDFQINAVTEGREAMGETITKLRYNGKIFSGRGISTDIGESGIYAYINALNKIVYEEDLV